MSVRSTLRPRRPVIALALTAAALLPAGGCASSASSASSSPSAATAAVSPSATGSSGPRTPTWQALPAAPLPNLDDAVGAWTGTEFIVAGDHTDNHGKPVSRAAAYDPGARHWRALAAPPTREQSQALPQSVWTGTELVVCGGFHHEIYNLETDRWREIPRSPYAPDTTDFALVWTGSRVVSFGGAESAESVSGNGGILDPATGVWSPLPKGPLTPRSGEAVWTGTEVVFVGGSSPDKQIKDVAALNPKTGRWRKLPALPFADAHQAFWDGRQIIATGNAGAAATWAPGKSTWTKLPPNPHTHDVGAHVLADDRLLALNGDATDSPSARGSVYSFATRTWSPLPHSRPVFRSAAIAWTGQELLVFGGTDDPSPVPNGPVGLELTF